jgi:predicted O-methyltransferase YrrM
MHESKYLLNAINKSRHTLPSIISSLDYDASSQSCDDLIKILAKSSVAASSVKIDCPSDKPDSMYFNTYPGEHYKLLAGLTVTIKPQCLVDIGTFTGMSSRIMLDYTSIQAEIHTFDIIGFNKFNSHLT